MELLGSEQAAQTARRLLQFFRVHQLPVIHVQHIAIRAGSTFFLPNTNGVEINSVVKPIDGELVIQKHSPNCFKETELLAHLQRMGTKRLVIAGMMTHMCVDAGTRAATDFGFSCRIAADACATRTLIWNEVIISAQQVQQAFLAALHGSYGRVLNTDEILGELMKEVG